MLAWLAALAAGCAAGPTYQAPTTADVELRNGARASVAAQPFQAAWWEQFGDPVLSALVERALANDLDLAIAATRVTEARAFAAQHIAALPSGKHAPGRRLNIR